MLINSRAEECQLQCRARFEAPGDVNEDDDVLMGANKARDGVIRALTSALRTAPTTRGLIASLPVVLLVDRVRHTLGCIDERQIWHRRDVMVMSRYTNSGTSWYLDCRMEG